MEEFGIETSRDGDGVVILVRGDVDLRYRDELADTASTLLNAEPVVIADLSGVTFLDSAGLSALIQARKRAERLGREFRVRSAPETVARALTVTGLAEWLAGSNSTVDVR